MVTWAMAWQLETMQGSLYLWYVDFCVFLYEFFVQKNKTSIHGLVHLLHGFSLET